MFLETLSDLSRMAKEDLPTHGSWSCFDLGVLLSAAALDNRSMTIKQVSLSLSCAESNVRRYLRVLESDGWLTVKRNPRDNRSNIVVPSRAMIDAYKQYFLQLATAAQQVKSLEPFRNQHDPRALPAGGPDGNDDGNGSSPDGNSKTGVATRRAVQRSGNRGAIERPRR